MNVELEIKSVVLKKYEPGGMLSAKNAEGVSVVAHGLFTLYIKEKNGEMFELHGYKHHKKWYPSEIRHDPMMSERKKNCLYCGETVGFQCEYLTRYVDEIYQKVLSHPSFRVEALFELS